MKNKLIKWLGGYTSQEYRDKGNDPFYDGRRFQLNKDRGLMQELLKHSKNGMRMITVIDKANKEMAKEALELEA
jgi:hypothetical protein